MTDAPQKRSAALFSLALGAVAVAVVAGYWFFLHEPPPAAPLAGRDAGAVRVAPDAAGPRVHDLQITEVSGTVEVRSGTGAFAPASVGGVLKADDALRTVEGRARLVSMDAYDVQVEPGTELEVQELTERLSKFRLGLGMVVAKVEGRAGRRLEVAARGSDAVAASKDGAFAVSNNGAGTVAVGAREGEVELTAAGKAVILRAGQQAVALPGAPPSEPAPLPASLFLKVDWPSAKELNRRQVVLTGKTSPGAVLLLAGRPVPVDKDGQFKALLPLQEGRNALKAAGLDVAGHSAADARELQVDTTAPETDLSTQKLWNP